MKKALRILTTSSATIIAPLGDPDAGDQIPTLEDIGQLVNAARINQADPWLTLNTMQTKVLATNIEAVGIIDYDPEAIARAQMSRMAKSSSSQSIGQPPAQQSSPTIDLSLNAAPEPASEPEIEDEGIESAPAVIG